MRENTNPDAKCGFCKNKGTFGKKSKRIVEKEEMDEATGGHEKWSSYKVVPTNISCKHRTLTSFPEQISMNQKSSEMYDDEEDA